MLGTAEATAAAQAAVGTASNPVVNVETAGSTLTITFADGTTRDETLPGPYTLPAATSTTRGGVRAITAAVVDAGTSTGIFGWAISHVRRLVESIVPAWARDDSTPVPAAKVPAAFSQLATETVTVTQLNEWTATALPVPATAVAGIATRAPDGTETGIHVFRTASLNGTAAAGGDATAVLTLDYAIETGSGGEVLFASRATTGAHVLYLYGIR